MQIQNKYLRYKVHNLLVTFVHSILFKLTLITTGSSNALHNQIRHLYVIKDKNIMCVYV